ncbi:MAG: sigma-70 family RNA polymerase sigma factor [Bacteroidales bacterium]|nr:RNA polymerase sigma factor RpoD/SigA [Bacteroidales bacterium]MDD6499184.1 RNA polymerase sigma factor RpoD/SigA [Bacteroidales bacterium]MDY3731908.1 RNA polymerase sigma factor RpoD/SigA [Alloprevotella sp.]
MRQLKITQSITSREGDSLERYLQEINKEPMITPEEEVVLAHRIHNGDDEALEQLTKANLRFVVSVAKQYQGQGLGLIDLINEGNVGLITAAKKFDETRGFKFISYAVWWIRQSILQALAENSRLVYLPLNQVNNLTKIHRFLSDFAQKNERTPSNEEIAEALDIDVEKVKTIMQSSGRPTSMDAPLADDEGSCLLDLLQSRDGSNTERDLITGSLITEVSSAVKKLPERERKVVEMFFGLNGPEMNLEDIGRELHLSRERVRQLKEKALKLLREAQEASILKTYL